jgi:hypothetical protein
LPFSSIYLNLKWGEGDFSHRKMFSVGKTELTVAQHKASRVFAMKGKKQITHSSADRSALITVVTCLRGPTDGLLLSE